MDKPNVILIICDDLNDSIEGMGGHDQAKTPNIKKLIDESVKFSNCQANAPICGPSRASFLTGIYPHTSGYFGYNQQQNHWRENQVLKDAVTIMEHCTNNGYAVYGTGKVFHNGHEDWSVWKGNGNDEGFGIGPSFGPWPWDGITERGNIGCGHPIMPEPLSKYWQQGFLPLSEIPEYKTDPEQNIPGYKGWRLFNKPFRYENDDNRDLMPDELTVNWAGDILNKEHIKPFFMAIGFNRPHMPLYAPKKYFDMFPLDEIKLPPYKPDNLEQCAEILWKDPKTWASSGFEKFDRILDIGGVALWKKWIQAYLACVAFVDHEVGRLMDYLKSSVYANNTLVIFTSDNGYHMGEKNYLFKNSLWEESCRVPLVIWGSDIASGEECKNPVSLVDIYPSIIDYCNLSQNPNQNTNGVPLDGNSMVSLLKDPEKGEWTGPEYALSAVASNDKLEINEQGNPERQFYSLRSENYRYILCNNGEEELYNHDQDQHEWENVADIDNYQAVKKEYREYIKNLIKNEKESFSSD